MSIVIAILEPEKGITLYADRKWVLSGPKGKIYAEGEVEKLHHITPTIACGYTGSKDWCEALTAVLSQSAKHRASELIELIKTYPYNGKVEGSTYILAGIYDNDRPFLFGYKSSGEFTLVQDQEADVFATSPTEYLHNCQEFFYQDLDLHNDLDLASIHTIEFAATQNPTYIGSNYNSIKIPAIHH